MSNSPSTESILALVDKHQGTSGSIIAILEDIQASYNYLPRNALEIVAKRTGHALVDLYATATFYSAFSLEPRGDHLLSVCVGTACHVRGAPAVLQEFEDQLGVHPGETTEDRSFTLTTVNCLGACALGPVAVADGEYCRNVKKGDVGHILCACKNSQRINGSADEEETLYVRVLCPRCNRSLMTSDHLLDGHPMIHVTFACGPLHGWLRLSSAWGDHRVLSEHDIPEDALVDFFCPRCHGELRSPVLCPRCDAPTIPLLNEKGGIVTLCSRRGCNEHMLNLS